MTDIRELLKRARAQLVPSEWPVDWGIGPLCEEIDAALAQPPTTGPLSDGPVAGEATPAARDVLAERQRQVSVLGWTPAHDDQHDGGDLSAAAAAYALAAADKMSPYSMGDGGFERPPPVMWPESWGALSWNPAAPRRMLVKAGALILAEIERLDRAAPQEPPASGEQP